MPFQVPEPSKIMVRRTQFRSMLEGECGEVGIGCQVAAGAQRKQEVAQHLSVARAWMDYGYGRLFEPGIHDVEGSFDS
jgi:hypothetical protein